MLDSLKRVAYQNYGFTIERTMKKIKQHLQHRFNEAQADLTVEQWVILDTLHHQNGLPQNAIADATFKDAPTVTRIIDQLCKKELALRKTDGTDRRKYNVYLTQKGEDLIVQLLPIVNEVRSAGWGNLTDDDFAQLIRILHTIFENLSTTEEQQA